MGQRQAGGLQQGVGGVGPVAVQGAPNAGADYGLVLADGERLGHQGDQAPRQDFRLHRVLRGLLHDREVVPAQAHQQVGVPDGIP